jgi:hypothetical protein
MVKKEVRWPLLKHLTGKTASWEFEGDASGRIA